MSRPAVDVVVPFRGSAASLAEARARLDPLVLGAQDTFTIVNNSPDGVGGGVLAAPALQTPGHARNAGARVGKAPWLVFLDADVAPAPDLLDAYFSVAPDARVAVLAGGVRDAAPSPGDGAAVRYAHLRSAMSQDASMERGRWSFAQTANAAVRRAAFDSVGGFREDIRAGEDADLSWRLHDAGWELERREEAVATHRSRATVRALVAQRACHGSAAGWLERTHPGSFPGHRLPGLTAWALRATAGGVSAAVRRGDRAEALRWSLDPLMTLAFEYGRLLSNERPRQGWRA